MLSLCWVTMNELVEESKQAGCCKGTLESQAAETEFQVAAHAATALCTSFFDRAKYDILLPVEN